MLINGQPFYWDDWDQAWDRVLEALRNLPSGFQQRTARTFERVEPELGAWASQFRKAAVQALDEFDNNPQGAAQPDKTLKALEQYIAISQQEKNFVEQADYLQICGEICNETGDGERAIPYLEESLALFKTLEYFDDQYSVLSQLHKAVRTAIAEKERRTDPPQSVEILKKKLGEVRQELVDAYLRGNNTAIELAAIRVEQGEVGFSEEALIGTDYVEECVVVVVRHPEKVAVAHIDRICDASSLEVIFQHMPDPTVDNPLEVVLLGARYSEPEDSSLSSQQNFQRSKGNIQKVMNILKNKHVDIKSAWVMDEAQPKAIVVNPKTFEIREANPWRHDRNSRLAFAILDINAHSKPLHVAFDLTESQQRAPVLLSAQNVFAVYGKGRNETEWCAWLQHHTQMSEGSMAMAVESHATVAKSHQEAVAYLNGCLDERIATLRKTPPFKKSGIEIDDVDILATKEALEEMAIHIGDGADAANQPIVDFIMTRKCLITVEKTTSGNFVARFDVEGLKNVPLPAQSYEAIRTTERLLKEQTAGLGKGDRSPHPNDGREGPPKGRKTV